MKISKLFTLVFVLAGTFLFSNTAKAQIIDSLPYFKTDIIMIGEISKQFDLLGSYNIPKGIQTKFVQVKVDAKTGKELSKGKGIALPNVKKLDGPIVLRRNGNCYKLGCPKKDCSNCALYWWDKNQDGKVQPKKELRCGCSDSEKACKMRVKKVECKKEKKNRE